MRGRRGSKPGVRIGLLTVNGVGVLIASAFSAQGLIKPNFADGKQPSSPLARFWAASSAVRTWSLAISILAGLARQRPVGGLLIAAGLVQFGDSVLGIQQRDRQMAIAPAVMGAIHLATAGLLTR